MLLRINTWDSSHGITGLPNNLSNVELSFNKNILDMLVFKLGELIFFSIARSHLIESSKFKFGGICILYLTCAILFNSCNDLLSYTSIYIIKIY
jgi:hypothetical protein